MDVDIERAPRWADGKNTSKLMESNFRLEGVINEGNEFDKQLMGIVTALDATPRLRFIIQNKSRFIVIDTLSYPRRAPNKLFSYSTSIENGHLGPIIPIRWAHVSRNDDNSKLTKIYIDWSSEVVEKMPAKRIESTLGSMSRWLRYLQRSSHSISEDCNRRFKDSKKDGDGVYKLGFLYVSNPHEIERAKYCGYPDCDKIGIFNCAKCKTPYCSQEHQKLDWTPAAHKAMCVLVQKYGGYQVMVDAISAKKEDAEVDEEEEQAVEKKGHINSDY